MGKRHGSHIDTNCSFYLESRERFPLLAQKADRHYLKYWGAPASGESAYSWFESVANALNEEMRREACLAESAAFFQFVAQVFASASDDVKRCIDVSLVENLFWQVPPAKSAAYWHKLPPRLQSLYAAFHHRRPL